MIGVLQAFQRLPSGRTTSIRRIATAAAANTLTWPAAHRSRTPRRGRSRGTIRQPIGAPQVVCGPQLRSVAHMASATASQSEAFPNCLSASCASDAQHPTPRRSLHLGSIESHTRFAKVTCRLRLGSYFAFQREILYQAHRDFYTWQAPLWIFRMRNDPAFSSKTHQFQRSALPENRKKRHLEKPPRSCARPATNRPSIRLFRSSLSPQRPPHLASKSSALSPRSIRSLPMTGFSASQCVETKPRSKPQT